MNVAGPEARVFVIHHDSRNKCEQRTAEFPPPLFFSQIHASGCDRTDENSGACTLSKPSAEDEKKHAMHRSSWAPRSSYRIKVANRKTYTHTIEKAAARNKEQWTMETGGQSRTTKKKSN
jgi:hypothetical protein